jgi:hypothetical protein
MMSCPAMAVVTPQGFMLDRAVGTLRLTEDQAIKLKAVTAKNDTTLRPLMEKAADASKALRTALLASDYDAKKVKELASAAEKAEAAVVTANIDGWASIRAALTADQFSKLKEAVSAPSPFFGRPGQFGQPQGSGGFPPPPGGLQGPPPGGGEQFGPPPPPGAGGEQFGPPPGDEGFPPPPALEQ